jgi:hypothetical protein
MLVLIELSAESRSLLIFSAVSCEVRSTLSTRPSSLLVCLLFYIFTAFFPLVRFSHGVVSIEPLVLLIN